MFFFAGGISSSLKYSIDSDKIGFLFHLMLLLESRSFNTF